MPAECKVCADPRVVDIDRALDGGRSVRDCAAAFNYSKSTIQRHDAHRAHPDTSPRPDGDRRPCLVCRSPDRGAIEEALFKGASAESLERDGASAETIRRHLQTCIPQAIRATGEGQAAELVQQARRTIEGLVAYADQLLEDARHEGTIRERAAALSVAARAAELLGKITGELGPDVEIRILELPQWAAIQTAILTALDPFPDAYDAVVRALRRVEHGAPALPPAGLLEEP